MPALSAAETAVRNSAAATPAGGRPVYTEITAWIEAAFERLGDSPQGMGWPNVPDAIRRYQVMLDVLRDQGSRQQPVRLLDLGCGCGHLYEYIRGNALNGIRYTGIDLSERFIQRCRTKHPDADFRQLDVLQSPELLEQFDYVVINGVFTQKCSISFEQMWAFTQSLIRLAFERSSCGIAFNVMSKHVDWERDDLFHLPLDTLAAFLCSHLSRHFLIRNDYGLYEYTTYVYHRPLL